MNQNSELARIVFELVHIRGSAFRRLTALLCICELVRLCIVCLCVCVSVKCENITSSNGIK